MTKLSQSVHAASAARTERSASSAAMQDCRSLLIYDHVPRQKAHAHRFVEFVLSLDGLPIDVDHGDKIIRAPAQIVAPQRRHAILFAGPVARLYIAIGLRRVGPLQAISAAVPGDSEGLRQAVRALPRKPTPETDRITLAWQRAWLPDFEAVPKVDPRIERAILDISALANPRRSRHGLSKPSGLSSSRFSALFRNEMGMPLGRYIIWRRILIALEYLKLGAGTTEAAVASGFSDAPHFCRCYRETFGSPPSQFPAEALIQHGDGLRKLVRI